MPRLSRELQEALGLRKPKKSTVKQQKYIEDLRSKTEPTDDIRWTFTLPVSNMTRQEATTAIRLLKEATQNA